MLALFQILLKLVFHAKSQGGEVLILPAFSFMILLTGALCNGASYGLFWSLAALFQLGAWNHSKVQRLAYWADAHDKMITGVLGFLLLTTAFTLFGSRALPYAPCVLIGSMGLWLMYLAFRVSRGALKPTDLVPPAQVI
jgi:hypothetical protein